MDMVWGVTPLAESAKAHSSIWAFGSSKTILGEITVNRPPPATEWVVIFCLSDLIMVALSLL